MKNPFAESNGEWSWRKTGAALTFLSFTYAVIGHLHTHNFDELPQSYLLIIAGVFAFYFSKKLIEGIQLKNKNEQGELTHARG